MNEEGKRSVEEVMTAHIDLVYAAALRQVKDPGLAEDVTQGVFLLFVRKGMGGAGGASRRVVGWLLKATYFGSRAALRGERRRHHEEKAGLMREMVAKEATWEELEAVLDGALMRLSESDREVVGLRFLEGLSVREVSVMLGISEEAARKRVERGLARLREILEVRGVKTGSGLGAVLVAKGMVAAPVGVRAAIGSGVASGRAVGISAQISKGLMWGVMKVAVVVGMVAVVLTAGVILVIGRGGAGGAGAVATSTPVVVAAAPPTEMRGVEDAWKACEELEPGASRGMLMMMMRPAETVAFLKEKLKPLRIDEKEVRGLIADLGSSDETVWRPAFERLEHFDPRLAIGLTTLMEEVKEEPARGRLVAVLSDQPPESIEEGMEIQLRKSGKDGYNFAGKHAGGGGMSWWAEDQVGRLRDEGFNRKRKWGQVDRGIVVLGEIGGPAAMEIVRGMTTGHAEAGPTKLAKETLVDMAAVATQPWEKEMEKWWEDLGKEGPEGWRAELRFSMLGAQTVGFFKTRLVPLKLEAAEAHKLVEALGSDNEAEWKGAAAKMAYFDPRLGVDVQELMQEAADPVTNSRLAEVLMDASPGSLEGHFFEVRRFGKDDYDLYDRKGLASYGLAWEVSKIGLYSHKKEWRRAVRAELVLGDMGTPEAVGILKEMAKGHGEAEPTRVAVEELGRMGK